MKTDKECKSFGPRGLHCRCCRAVAGGKRRNKRYLSRWARRVNKKIIKKMELE